MSDDWRADLHRDLTRSRSRKRAAQPYDSFAWKARRAELRDGATCVLCARFGEHVPAEIADHVCPVTAGGNFEGELQPLCSPCHRIKKLVEGRWRRGELPASELDFRTSREAARLRAPIGVDGFAIRPVNESH